MQPNRVPDFLIIGAMKSGTTSLYDDLIRHPQIYMPKDKEPWVLTEDRDEQWLQKRYNKLFHDAGSKAMLGEATTGYAFSPLFGGVPRRANSICGPKLKIIYIVRDPVERAISHLRHDVRAGRISVEKVNGAARTDSRYVDVSNYGYQLSEWLKYYPIESFHIVSFSRYIRDRVSEFTNLVEFLGLDATGVEISAFASNNSEDAKRISAPLKMLAQNRTYRQKLHRYVPDSVRNLAKSIFSRDLDESKKKTPIPSETVDWLRQKLEGVGRDLEKVSGVKL